MNTKQCFCIGPQNCEPKCPCQMRGVTSVADPLERFTGMAGGRLPLNSPEAMGRADPLERFTGNTYGITIKNGNGEIYCAGTSLSDIICSIVDSAIMSGWKPRLYWWQLWRNAWPDECVKEYLNRMEKAGGETR